MHAFLATVAFLGLIPQELRTLTPAAMQEDVFKLSETLTSLHSGLTRYSSAEEMEEAFSAVAFAAEEGPRDVLWFYRELSAVVARIRCGHTRLRIGDRDRAAVLARRGLLPCEVHLVDRRAWVRRVLDEGAGLRPGQELLAIDGLATAEVVTRAFARLPDDGVIESGKERDLEQRFAEYYALLVAEPGSGPYLLQVAGAAQPLSVAGLAPDVFTARREVRPERPLFVLSFRPEAEAAVLAVSVFGDRPGEASWPEQLEGHMRTLRERGIRRLVLDLRGNGGGVDMYGALLVSYLASKPFRYFERIEVTPDYRGDVEIVERDGRRLMLSHDGLKEQQPAELRFQGDVVVLIDGLTFSTAADVATVAHVNRLATFLGEETGGGYEGNNSGDSRPLVLSNASFSIQVQEWKYTTAGVTPGHEARGVVPDVALEPSIEDVLAGRDPVLERALAHLTAARR